MNPLSPEHLSKGWPDGPKRLGLEQRLRFLKAFKSLNSFRDFQVPLGNKVFLRCYGDIDFFFKSRFLEFEHVVSGAPRRVHGGLPVGPKRVAYRAEIASQGCGCPKNTQRGRSIHARYERSSSLKFHCYLSHAHMRSTRLGFASPRIAQLLKKL